MKARALRYPDGLAVLALFLLWLLFFWRLFTPIEADQASLKQGDFSGQFVAFAAYQYERFSQWQVPLWNPYNNGGLPFIADTQAAVFYPPRLLTIALAHAFGGFSYRTLEWEMTAHVLMLTLAMYLFMRLLTRKQRGTYSASFVSAVTMGYGGFMTGYPPLQLAILEAGTWLPLALVGIHLATSHEATATIPTGQYSFLFSRYPALILTGFALGMSWMAGHPQTSFLMTWLLVAYFAFCIHRHGRGWRGFLFGVACFGFVAFGLASVQLLPGLEYLRLTTRSNFGFDAKGNGFPIQDVFQVLVPNVVSLFSPLYFGVTGLVLALVALWRRSAESWFWGGAAGLALVWSFGANSLLYPLIYNTLPGAYFFRGQERAAFIVAVAGAVLAGLGIVRLMAWRPLPTSAPSRWLRRLGWGNAAALAAVSALVLVAWLGDRDSYSLYLPYFALSTLVAIGCALLIPIIARMKRPLATILLAGLVTFELFTVSMDSAAVYDSRPPSAQLVLAPPPLIQRALDDANQPFRVDGFRGLGDNYGSLYQLADIRGISPLWLGSAYALIEGELPDEIAWELFAVRYVYSDWNELPVPAEIVGRGTDRFGDINLHQLSSPRPFALAMNSYETAADDSAARARLADPAFDPRTTLLLRDPLPPITRTREDVTIRVNLPMAEQVVLQVSSPGDTVLSISLVDYPGWYATINDQPANILRAYGGLMAIEVPGGESTIHLTFDPLSYRIGAAVSLATWISIAILGITMLTRRWRP